MILVAGLGLLVLAAFTKAQCNPLQGTCPAIPGLASSTYSVDFTQQHSLPPNWTLADYATVNYGSNGAEFTFNKRFDSPYMWTSFYVLFGKIEVVFQAAPGTGIVSSSVMMSDDLDEIDWEWSGSNFGSSSGKVQTNYFGKGITGNYDRGTQPSVTNPETMFHTYTIDWTPTALTWYIDDVAIRTVQNSGATSGAYQYPQTPSRLHLGLWNAGDQSEAYGVVAWAGGYTDLSKAPFTAYAKSVKITNYNPCSSWQYPPNFSGSWQDVKCTNQTIPSNSPSSSTSSVTSAPTNLPCTYNVASGDYGYGIAGKLGVTFDALSTANPGQDWDKLLIGQALKVPGGNCSTTQPSSSSTQTAKSTASSLSTTPQTSLTSTTKGSSTSLFPTSGSPTTAPTISTSSLPTKVQSVPSSSASPVGTTYTVIKGDYGYEIASKLGCDFNALSAANPGVDWNNLNIGQVLLAPGSAIRTSPITSATSTSKSAVSSSSSTSSSTTSKPSSSPSPASSSLPSICTYTVVAGDYGYKIADKIGITFDLLSTVNPNLDWNKLSVGQTLKVPGIGCSQSSSSTSSSSPNRPASTSSQSSTSKTISSAGSITTPSLTCNHDNCLNNLLDPRFISSVIPFCSNYIDPHYGAYAMAIPTYLSGCQQKASRVSSACSCVITSSTSQLSTTSNAGPKSAAAASTTGSSSKISTTTSSNALSSSTIPASSPSPSLWWTGTNWVNVAGLTGSVKRQFGKLRRAAADDTAATEVNENDDYSSDETNIGFDSVGDSGDDDVHGDSWKEHARAHLGKRGGIFSNLRGGRGWHARRRAAELRD